MTAQLGPQAEIDPAGTDRSGPPPPCRASSSTAPAGVARLIVAAALVGSLLVVPSTLASGQESDAPPEEIPTEESDAPPEEIPTEDPDTPPEEIPTEDPDTPPVAPEDPDTPESPEESAPPAGAAADPAGEEDPDALETFDEPAEPEKEHRGGAPYGCPPRPASRYHDDVASWSDWCLDDEYWIVEVICGPRHIHPGRTVRFDADPRHGAQPSLLDVCGVVECPPASPATPATGEAAAPGGILPAGTLLTTGPGGETYVTTPSGEALVTTGDAGTFVTTEVDGTPAGDDAGADGAAATADGQQAERAATPLPDEPCGAPWPAGSWYQVSEADPITGAVTSVGRLSGAWRGARDHRAGNTPTFVMRCESAALSVTVRTGGVFAGYRRGVPVEYRVGETIVSQQWQEITATEIRHTGVLVPAWLEADFVTLLVENPRGEFVIRVFGFDGAPVGAAAFDLAGIGSITEPVLRTCGP